MKKTIVSALLALTAVALGASAATAPSKVAPPLAAQQVQDKAAAASQKKVDATAAGTQDMLNKFLEVTSQKDQLQAYDDQLEQIVNGQNEEINSLTQQTSQVGGVKGGLLPLMLQMVDSLDQYVKLDIPYHLDTRQARVQQLRSMMTTQAASVNDVFQKLVQAYNDEIAAGKTVEAYRGELTADSKTRTVNFLRIGHLALAYQTLDRSETGYWDKQKHQWQVGNDYRDAVAEAIAVANKQAAPDLMEVPVTAPEAGK